MYWLHGPGPSRVFVGDQVTWNLDVLDGSPLYRIPAYLGSLVANLLPWSILLIPLALYDRASLVPDDARARRAQRLILVWSALMAVIFGLGNKIEPRYALPAGPLWAILLAGALGRAEPRLTSRLVGYLLAATLAVVGVLGVAMAALDGVLLGPGAAFAVLALFAAVTATIALITRRPGGLSPAAGVSLAVFLAYPLAAVALGPALDPDQGVRTMARDLERAHRPEGEPVLVTGPEFLANKLRIATGGRVAIDSWSPLPPAPDRWPAAMVLPAAQAATLDLSGYRVREVPAEVRSVPVLGLLGAMGSGRTREFLDARRDRYVVALRR
jgi:4-amino-4-deoxy-L-arabinose transferase-like glycosyltransferase